MKCKHCQAELDEGVTLCPECGTENAAPETPVQAPAEAPKAEPEMTPGLTPGKITLLVALAVAAVAVVIALIVGGMSGTKTPGETTVPTTDPTETTAPAEAATVPASGNPEEVICKGSYTVTDDEMTAAVDTVVATMGDAELTNGELQVYYWMQVYDFLNQYATYASMLGLDLTQGMDSQLSMDGTMSWQQYFLEGAIITWQNYQALTLAAEADAFQLDAEYADYLENLPQELETSAVSNGFASALDMIQADMGAGASTDAYLNYLRTYYMGYFYYSSELENIVLTDEEVEAFFDENSESYLANGLEKNDADKYVDVRHILTQPTGGTVGEDGKTTYSDEEWAACKKQAEDILNEWLSGEQTEAHFAALATTYSTDGGSKSNGGLYTDVYVGQMVEPFEDWCFDESRKPGDYGIVQTNYGYHVMYFVSSEPIWYATAWSDLMATRSDELMEDILATYPMAVDYSKMVLGDVTLVSQG